MANNQKVLKSSILKCNRPTFSQSQVPHSNLIAYVVNDVKCNRFLSREVTFRDCIVKESQQTKVPACQAFMWKNSKAGLKTFDCFNTTKNICTIAGFTCTDIKVMLTLSNLHWLKTFWHVLMVMRQKLYKKLTTNQAKTNFIQTTEANL